MCLIILVVIMDIVFKLVQVGRINVSGRLSRKGLFDGDDLVMGQFGLCSCWRSVAHTQRGVDDG